MSNIDWYYLRRSLIIFALSIIVAASLIIVGLQFESAQVKKYENALSTLSTTHKLYTNIVNDIDLLDQYKSLYSGYKSSGLVGEERRLSWIESLEATNEVLKLPTLTYNLRPQEKFERPGFAVSGDINVNSSPMELTMGLLHEEDIFAVFEGLRLSIKSLFTVDSCSLSRNISIGNTWNTKETNLLSKCTIRWVTIDVK